MYKVHLPNTKSLDLENNFDFPINSPFCIPCKSTRVIDHSNYS